MKRFWTIAGALVVTLATLALAMALGSASFDYRRYTQHQDRLRRVMREQPTVERLTRGLTDEGSAVVAAPQTSEDEERVIASRGGRKTAELRAKAERYPQLRVYAATDMLYFIFFDGTGVMRDFTCVSR